VRRMQRAARVSEAADLLRDSGQAVGLPHVAAVFDASVPTPALDEDGQRLSHRFGWPPGFVEKWMERNLTGRSPSLVRARFELLPFTWAVNEPLPEGDQEAGAPEVLEALLNLGITGGIMAPVRMPRGRLGAVNWMGRGDAQTLEPLLERHGPMLLALAHYFFEHIRAGHDLPTVAEDRARLTPREVECLRAAASGYSDLEVAKITGLSAHTVRFHHRRAQEKLGARSRAAAVALATQLGLLGPVS